MKRSTMNESRRIVHDEWSNRTPQPFWLAMSRVHALDRAVFDLIHTTHRPFSLDEIAAELPDYTSEELLASLRRHEQPSPQGGPSAVQPLWQAPGSTASGSSEGESTLSGSPGQREVVAPIRWHVGEEAAPAAPQPTPWVPPHADCIGRAWWRRRQAAQALGVPRPPAPDGAKRRALRGE